MSNLSLRNAKNLGVLSTTKTARGSLGARHRSDLFRFKLTQRSNFSTSISLSGGASTSLRLLDNSGNKIAVSNLPGQRLKQIATTLPSGTYYLRVNLTGKGSTRYSLVSAAAAVPVATPTPTPDPAATIANRDYLLYSLGSAYILNYYGGQLSAQDKYSNVLNTLEAYSAQGDSLAGQYASRLVYEYDTEGILIASPD